MSIKNILILFLFLFCIKDSYSNDIEYNPVYIQIVFEDINNSITLSFYDHLTGTYYSITRNDTMNNTIECNVSDGQYLMLKHPNRKNYFFYPIRNETSIIHVSRDSLYFEGANMELNNALTKYYNELGHKVNTSINNSIISRPNKLTIQEYTNKLDSLQNDINVEVYNYFEKNNTNEQVQKIIYEDLKLDFLGTMLYHRSINIKSILNSFEKSDFMQQFNKSYFSYREHVATARIAGYLGMLIMFEPYLGDTIVPYKYKNHLISQDVMYYYKYIYYIKSWVSDTLMQDILLSHWYFSLTKKRDMRIDFELLTSSVSNKEIIPFLEQQNSSQNLFMVTGNDTIAGYKIFQDLLKQYENQVIVMNFWATWCGPCHRELKTLDSIKIKLGNDIDKIGFVNICCLSNLNDYYSDLEQMNTDSDNIFLTNIEYQYFQQKFNVKSFPKTILVDIRNDTIYNTLPRPSQENLFIDFLTESIK